MPALVQTDVIAGPFTVEYSAPSPVSFATLGLIGPAGIRVLQQRSGEPIVSDRYGDTILNGVHRGGNVYIEFQLLEANKTTCKQMTYPWSESSPGWGFENELGIVGSLWSSNAGQFRATPVANTPAAAETTPIRTFGLVILAPGHSIDAYLKAGLKSFPIRLLCLPYADSGDSNKIKWYTRS